MKSPPTPHPHPCLLRAFSASSSSPDERRRKQPAKEEGEIGPHKRPTKLAMRSPPSGRPSVTFSLVLEEQIGGGTEQSGGGGGAGKKEEKEAEWPPNCGSPTTSSSLGGTSGGGGDEEPRVHLLLFCASVPLMECARFVGWLATIPIVISLFLLPFAPSSLVELVPELLLFAAQSISVLALFYGLQHQLPNYLRPFLLFGLFWNLLLLLLFLFSLMELLVARERFCAQIWLTVYELVHGQIPPTEAPPRIDPSLDPVTNLVLQLYNEDQSIRRAAEAALLPPKSPAFALWLSLSLVLLLALTILVDGWLLNIVLLAYLHMKRSEAKGKRRNGGDWYALESAGGGGGADDAESRQALLSSPLSKKHGAAQSPASRSNSCGKWSLNSNGDNDSRGGIFPDYGTKCNNKNGGEGNNGEKRGRENGGYSSNGGGTNCPLAQKHAKRSGDNGTTADFEEAGGCHRAQGMPTKCTAAAAQQ